MKENIGVAKVITNALHIVLYLIANIYASMKPVIVNFKIIIVGTSIHAHKNVLMTSVQGHVNLTIRSSMMSILAGKKDVSTNAFSVKNNVYSKIICIIR